MPDLIGVFRQLDPLQFTLPFIVEQANLDLGGMAENSAKLVPLPSHVAPRGNGAPSRTPDSCGIRHSSMPLRLDQPECATGRFAITNSRSSDSPWVDRVGCAFSPLTDSTPVSNRCRRALIIGVSQLFAGNIVNLAGSANETSKCHTSFAAGNNLSQNWICSFR